MPAVGSPTGDSKGHLAEIDHLKGFAILCVVCIHAKTYADTWLFANIFNRAVPIFLVLFGITSELSLSAADRTGAPWITRAKQWLEPRVERLVPPWFGLAIAFWLTAWRTGFARFAGFGLREVALTFMGYAPWIGTSWFVTVIFQLLLWLPAWRFIAIRMRLIPALALSGAVTFGCVYYLWEIVDVGRDIFGTDAPEPCWYYQWIFSPRVLWHVTVGLFVARLWGCRIEPRLMAIFAVATVAGLGLMQVARGDAADFFLGSLREQGVQYLVDAPLALALLGLFRWLSLSGIAGRALTYLGKSSWGIYLAHLWVHEAFHAFGLRIEETPNSLRVIYAIILFVSGTAITAAASAVAPWLGLPGYRRRTA